MNIHARCWFVGTTLSVFQTSSDLLFLKDLQSAGLQACNSKIGNNIIISLHLLIENGFLYLEKIGVLSYSYYYLYFPIVLSVSCQSVVRLLYVSVTADELCHFNFFTNF